MERSSSFPTHSKPLQRIMTNPGGSFSKSHIECTNSWKRTNSTLSRSHRRHISDNISTVQTNTFSAQDFENTYIKPSTVASEGWQRTGFIFSIDNRRFIGILVSRAPKWEGKGHQTLGSKWLLNTGNSSMQRCLHITKFKCCAIDVWISDSSCPSSGLTAWDKALQMSVV